MFFLLILFLIGVKVAAQYFLDYRQWKAIVANEGEVPLLFREGISLEEHQKAAAYSRAKLKVGSWWRPFHVMILVFWLWGGLFFLQNLAFEVVSSSLMANLLFCLLFSLVGMVLEIPHSLYVTFVLEERFGFNKMTLSLFFKDLLKELLLSLLLGGPLLFVLLSLMESYPDHWWVLGFVVLTLFQFVLMWAYPAFIAPLFNRFTPLAEGSLKEKLLALLKKIDFPSNGLFVMDASRRTAHGNAYFTGVGKKKRIVLFDTLLKDLSDDEVVAILAHELGHFKKRHIRKQMILSFVLGFFTFALMGYLSKQGWFFESFALMPQSGAMLLLFSLLGPLFNFWFHPLFAWKSRKNEYEADAFAKHYSSGEDLKRALIKLYRDNASTLTPDSLYSAFYYSHPAAYERVMALDEGQSKSIEGQK